jgi:peptidoglycan hydrolase-like protein with peptidoglycan-binding domain
VTMTALAGSNALFFQTAEHPSPFFAAPRDAVSALPTPAVDRPETEAPSAREAIAPIPTPVTSNETTGSVPTVVAPLAAPVVAVPDAPVGNEQMFAVQKKLFELQLFTGKVDGYYGPRTAEAIRAFEQRNGMPLTGANEQGVIDAILGSDASGRVAAQPQAAVVPAPVPQPAQVQQASLAPAVASAPAPAAAPADQVVARLPALSPGQQVFDNVAQSAASTIDSIIAAVDTPRDAPNPVANPPIPTASLPAQATQPMPAPVQVAATLPPAQVQPVAQPAPVQVASAAPAQTTAPVPPATDRELVMQIQRGLASLGFFRAPIDGEPGPETARAIREFENFHRYRMTGQVQPDLVELLVKAGATI